MNHRNITDKSGKEYHICKLTRRFALGEATTLLYIHNIIPHVRWSTTDLLAGSSPKGVVYTQKWRLSFVVCDGDRTIALLIAYKRETSDTHPTKAIYVHRLAVAPEYQGKGIGSALLQEALLHYSRAFPEIETYTVQTNDEAANEKVIEFYKNAGFERFNPVQYPDKLDILLKLEKADLLARATC